MKDAIVILALGIFCAAGVAGFVVLVILGHPWMALLLIIALCGTPYKHSDDDKPNAENP